MYTNPSISLSSVSAQDVLSIETFNALEEVDFNEIFRTVGVRRPFLQRLRQYKGSHQSQEDLAANFVNNTYAALCGLATAADTPVSKIKHKSFIPQKISSDYIKLWYTL